MSRQRRAQSRPSTPSRFRPGWAAGGAALAALGLLAVILVPGADGPPGDERSAEELPAAEPAADQSSDAAASDVLATDLPVADGVFLSRDPFEPVVPEEDPDPAADPTDPDADPNDTDPTDPNADPVDTDPDPDGCHGNDELVCDGQVLTLIEVSDPNGDPVAVFQVNTTRYEVSPGEAFADGFVLDRITGDGCAWVEYGDEAHLQCPGEVRLK